jgi:hypothetical protein
LRKSGDNLETQARVFPGDAVELNFLAGRRWNEIASESEPAIGRTTDRGRMEFIIHGQEEYKVRVEVKSSKRETGHNHSLGTLTFFQIKSALLGMKLTARATFWNIEHADASLAMHESSVYGAFPLVSLDGTGRRIALMLTKYWSGFHFGGKIAHTVSTSADDTSEYVDLALELGFNR